MANRDCNGNFFTADSINYYRCLWDGKILINLKNGVKCENCNRIIDGTDIEVIETKIVKVATLSDGLIVQLPNT